MAEESKQSALPARAFRDENDPRGDDDDEEEDDDFDKVDPYEEALDNCLDELMPQVLADSLVGLYEDRCR